MRTATFSALLLLPFVALGHDHDHAHPPTKVEYVENRGQWPQQVLYKGLVNGAVVFLEQDALTWVKHEEGVHAWMHDSHMLDPEEMAARTWKGHAWRVRFDGASVPTMRTAERSPAYHNYFIGNDPAKWAGEVPLHGEVVYEGLWPGIDMRMYGVEGSMKYDLVIAPGADPAAIAFAYDGVDGLRTGPGGDLLVATSVGDIIEKAPLAFYADARGGTVPCRFMIEGSTVRFHFPQGHDASRPVTIDPLLLASTLSGATGASNYGHCATYDDAGNIYVGSRSYGAGYPATVGAFQMTFGGGGTDVAVSKYNPDGSQLVYASYLGGSSGDAPHSLIVTSGGELCVFSSSSSSDYPVTPGCFDNSVGGTDFVITRFNAAGTALIGSTFVGGSGTDGQNTMGGNYGEAFRGEIYLDAAENILVAGFSSSPDFPTTSGAYQTTLGGGQDGVVFALDPTCSNMLYATYIGGTQADGAFGLRIADNGDLFVVGHTASTNFPTTPGTYQPTFQGGATDAFVVRLAPAVAGLVSSTYFGTAAADRGYFLDTDLNGDVWIYGQTAGSVAIQPAGTYGTAGGSGGVFVAKLTADLTGAPVTTKIGTTMTSTVPVAFLVDVCDHIYISGYNSSSGLPLTPDNLYGSGSFYLAAFEVDMVGMLFGSYYGGSHVDGGTSRFDKNGIVYQGVCSGGGFPTTPWAWADDQTVGWDIGVFKIDFQVAGVNAAGGSTLNQGCAPVAINFSNTSTGDQWIWDFGDGSPTVDEFEPSHTYTEPGEYIVTLIVMDSLSCNLADTTYLPITIGQQQPITAGFTHVQSLDCDVLEIVTTNTSTGTPLAFHWDMGDGTVYGTDEVTHVYDTEGDYTVQLIAYDPTGCSASDTVVVQLTIGPPSSVSAVFTVAEEPGCEQSLYTCTVDDPSPTATYTWTMSDGTVLTGPSISHTFIGVGVHTVELLATDPNSCTPADSTTQSVQVEPSVPVDASFTVVQQFDCDELLLTTTNTSTGTDLGFLWTISDGASYTDTDITHQIQGAGDYTVTLTVSDTLGCSPPSTMTLPVTIDPLVPVLADFEVEQVGNCSALTVLPINQSTGDSVSYVWDMGDGTLYNGEPSAHTYTTPGSYTITLTVTDLGCGQNDQTALTVSLIDQLPVVLLGDTVICPEATAQIVAGGSTGAYLWNTGDTTASIVVAVSGTYTVTVTTDDCQGTASMDLIAGPVHDLAYTTDACPGQGVEIRVPIEGLSYAWAHGGNARSAQVVAPGVFPFSVVDLWGCPHADTVRVEALDAEPQLFAPNAFTPDGDGVNDVFAVTGYGEQDAQLTVFNRWGERLWEAGSNNIAWDGVYQGSVVKNDVYVYELRYTGVCNAEEKRVIGHVTVVR